jgi:hypothetical protein
MVAQIVFQDFVNAANRLERGREPFWFLRKNMFGRQPIIEPQVHHSLGKTRTDAAKQHGYSSLLHVMQKVVKAFQCHHVGIGVYA